MKQLKVLYLSVFILGAVLIVPTHLFPQPYFMYARFPHYLEIMPPLFGIKWPMTFEIYHYALYTLVIIASLNVLGIIFYPKFKKIAIMSSLTGIFLFSAMVLFLFFKFINVNASTSIVYGLYSASLLILDWLTFKALTTRRKGA